MSDQRRSAERVKLTKPIEATIVDVPARMVEISLLNCLVEHAAKVPMGSNVTLQFQLHGTKVRLKGRIIRSEMRTVSGRLTYLSALEFSKSLEDSPEPLRRLIGSLLGEPEATSKPEPTPPPPKTAPPSLKTAEVEEIEELEVADEIPPKRYVECVLNEGKWSVREVTDPKQPAEGFTMLAPDSEREIREFCKTFEVADPETRQMIRLSFELAIARLRG